MTDVQAPKISSASRAKGRADAGLARVRFSWPRDQTDARLQGRIHQAGVEHEPGVADGGWER